MKFILVLLLIIVMQFVFMSVPEVYAAQSRVGLGTADTFAVLAGTGITNTGATTITGDVGSSAVPTETGFGTVTIISGTNHTDPNPNDATTQGAKTDLVTAYNDAAGRLPATTISADLGGQTLTAGVYNSGSSIGLTGTVTLNAEGDANAVFIFQAGSTLTTAPGSKVSLTNGAQACNVYWQIGSSATIDTTTSFIGNVLALTSITVNTGATINGRVLARNGAVTLDTNTITKSSCAAGTTGGPALTSNTTSSALTAAGPPPAQTCPAFSCITPIILESRRVSPTSLFLSWGPYAGINQFSVQYGVENGKWLYNTDVTGFSVILNQLPPNRDIWVLISPRDNCSIGSCGVAKLVEGTGVGGTGGTGQTGSAKTSSPFLPNTGVGSENNNIPWNVAILVGILVFLSLIQRKYRFLSKH